MQSAFVLRGDCQKASRSNRPEADGKRAWTTREHSDETSLLSMSLISALVQSVPMHMYSATHVKRDESGARRADTGRVRLERRSLSHFRRAPLGSIKLTKGVPGISHSVALSRAIPVFVGRCVHQSSNLPSSYSFLSLISEIRPACSCFFRFCCIIQYPAPRNLHDSTQHSAGGRAERVGREGQLPRRRRNEAHTPSPSSPPSLPCILRTALAHHAHSTRPHSLTLATCEKMRQSDSPSDARDPDELLIPHPHLVHLLRHLALLVRQRQRAIRSSGDSPLELRR